MTTFIFPNAKPKEVEDVYVDMLIDLIDGLVERTENYKEDVEQWLCSAF
jgi:hypothetical protein